MPNRYLGKNADDKLNALSQIEDVSRSKMIEKLILNWEKPDVVDLRYMPSDFVASFQPHDRYGDTIFTNPNTGMQISAKRVGRTWYLLDLTGDDKQ